ncbi:MAG: hypothetical protein LBQ79_12865 [Deltaproteobacteria bacterium]|jgi:hypothetical protein|nr:hypothetical protein [Deltaproteobacteria bacterium]
MFIIFIHDFRSSTDDFNTEFERASAWRSSSSTNTPHTCEIVAERGTDVVTSVHGGLKDPSGLNGTKDESAYTLADFRTDEAGAVTECP